MSVYVRLGTFPVMQKLIIILVLVLISQITFAGNKHKKKPIDVEPVANSQQIEDSELVKVNTLQKRTRFVEAKNVKVIKILPDDNKGLPHQKFVVQLSDSRLITIVSNLKMCEKIPVEISDVISVGGEYIPSGKFSGIIHWTHFDPSKKRPNGYIAMGDKLFCTSKK